MNSNNTFFDDIYISDADTQSPLGQIVSKRVNGAGNLTQFSGTPTGNTTHYLNVDEIPPNGKTDYNISGSSSEYDLYALEDSATSPAISTSDSINGVKAVWQTWRSSGSSQGGTHDNAWRENGTNNSSAPGMGTSPINWTTIWESPPESGGTWNTAKLDGLELGARHNGTQAQTTSISYAAAMVDYTSASLVPEVALFLTPLAFVAPKLLKSIQQGTLKEDIMQMLLKVFSVVPGILKQWRNLFFRVKKKREQKEKQKWRAEYVPII